MLTEATALAPPDVAGRRIVRLAVGTSLSLWFSQALAWDMSFVAPVFTLLLLATPKPLGLKGGVVVSVLITLAAYAGLLLLPLLLHQTAAGILILTLVLFKAFHFSARGGNPALGTLMVVSLTLTAAVGSVSVDAVLIVAGNLSLNAAAGVVFVLIAHALLPDPPMPAAAQSPSEPPAPDPAVALRGAMRSLAIVLPVVIFLLYSSDSAGYIAVMIKVTSMTQQVSKSKTRDAAVALIMSTLIGGIAAWLGWLMLGVWPLLMLYTLYTALVGLLAGRRIFAGAGMHPKAPVWSYAYLTMIVLLAPAVMDSLGGSPASAAFFDRLIMFALATFYGVAAVYIFDAFWPAKRAQDRG